MRILISLLTIKIILTASFAFAGVATCKVKIHDVNKGTRYSVEENFTFDSTSSAQRKNFEVPGNDYKCTFAFFDLTSGTMIACEYKKDNGITFFQSDRSALKELPKSNRLTFRHESAFISLDASCN